MLFRELLVGDRFWLPALVKNGGHSGTWVKSGYDGAVRVDTMGPSRRVMGSDTFAAMEPDQVVRRPFSVYVADGRSANAGRSAWPLLPGESMPTTTPTLDPCRVYALAIAFAANLSRTLSGNQLYRAASRNREETDRNVCHSHDFCDANEDMADAFDLVVGRAASLSSDADLCLWNAAWDYARNHDLSLNTLLRNPPVLSKEI